MTDSWRLLIDGPVEGAVNMARDRAIQLAVEAGEAPPTLRLYWWARPTVTLGRFQDVSGADMDFARQTGIDVVRRFTGGRGVLHDDELTYAVVARTDDGIPRGVAASYRYLSNALAAAYRAIGLAAEVTETDRPATRSSACYLATTRADLAFDARKLSGSAQVWHGRTVMQHGSFVIARDLDREARVFGLDAAQTCELSAHAVTIEAVLGRRVTREALCDRVVRAFESTLKISLNVGTITAGERAREDELLGQVVV